jgi:predicted metal-dependent peptidase
MIEGYFMLQISHEMPVAERIRKARTALLLDHPFFGALLFRLKGEECRSIPTMATNGVVLRYNPAFVDLLNAATLAGVLAHEVMHPALQHHTRRAKRDPRRWNEACDYAINPLLLDAGLILPDDVLVDPRFRGMSAEQIYSLREAEAQPESGGESGSAQSMSDDQGSELSDQTGNDSNDGSPSVPESQGGIGQVIDAPEAGEDESVNEEQAREWEIAVNQAATLAQQAGKVPAGLRRTLEGAAEAKVDWREMLRRLWSDTIPADSSWMRPNRRHIWSGLYLPGVVREGAGEIAIAVDCSGSVNARQLRLFEAEIRSILEGQRPERVHVLYFDAEVHKVDTYVAGEMLHLEPVGGGGTDFGPCFDWINEHGIHPQTMVFLTDLYGSFPESAPDYPVIWASTGSRQAPFGSVIPMHAA